MGRSPSFEKGLKKGPWTSEEDQKLVAYIQEHGHGSWRSLPLKAGLQRCGKRCRLRWTNYLRPNIKRGEFSLQEEQTIMQLHALLGNRWSTIAAHLPRRTDNEIKNHWNTRLKKRLTNMGIDPVTHKSRIAATANLSHMTQWEHARLEAEARLVRESSLVSKSNQQIYCGSVPFINKSLMEPLSQPQPLCLDVLKAWQGIVSCNLSNLSGTEVPIATLNLPKSALPPQSSMQNQATSVKNLTENTEVASNKDMTITKCTNDWEISKDQFSILGSNQNAFEINNVVYDQDNYLMEAVTNRHVNNENYVLVEDNNDNWSYILEILENNSSVL